MRRAFRLAAALLAPALAASSAAAEPPTVRIEVVKFAFVPADITVAPGTRVVWVNHDETPHTVAARDQRFVSKALDTDDTYARTFDDTGDVAYFCTVHPFMGGVVHVRAGATAGNAGGAR